jgi:hypothetical protein
VSEYSLHVKADKIADALEPEEGWWKSGTRDSLAAVAFDMLEAGMDSQNASLCIQSIIATIREEYGE